MFTVFCIFWCYQNIALRTLGVFRFSAHITFSQPCLVIKVLIKLCSQWCAQSHWFLETRIQTLALPDINAEQGMNGKCFFRDTNDTMMIVLSCMSSFFSKNISNKRVASIQQKVLYNHHTVTWIITFLPSSNACKRRKFPTFAEKNSETP